MRIALSYHGGDADYAAYAEALLRRAYALHCDVETVWLAGKGLPTRVDLLDDAGGLVLTGGPDVEPRRYGFHDRAGVCRSDPERDAIEWAMLERLQVRPLPVLAICRGAQLLNIFYGGTLVPDLGSANAVHRRNGEERRAHDVTIRAQSALQALVGAATGTVNSSHHQAVDRLASVFTECARSTDGVTEAFERTERSAGPFLLAVQWHPEAMEPGLPLGSLVLDGFLQAKH